MGRHGQLRAVGVEGPISYGAGLTQVLLDQSVAVVESTGRTVGPDASGASLTRSTPRPRRPRRAGWHCHRGPQAA
jgi:hypothetical protein